jgi:hypothetical protein
METAVVQTEYGPIVILRRVKVLLQFTAKRSFAKNATGISRRSSSR